MGGVVKNVTGGIQNLGKVITGKGNIKDVARAGLGMMTFGTTEALGIGSAISNIGRNPSAPMTMGGQQSPLDLLTQTGGAPLLTSISLGVKPDDALASYFGIQPADWKNWLSTKSPSEQSAISSLSTQLNEISINTDVRNQAVTKLVQDFPNYMQEQIPKYQHLMDDGTKQTLNDAMNKQMQATLNQSAAKYAAGGQLSSGAMEEAQARVGAEYGVQNALNERQYNQQALQYGTNMALQDWNNQYSNASALQNFQQKMLGGGAGQGFNAIQNMVAGNRQQQMQQNQFGFEQNIANQQGENAMYGALGQLGGTVIGGMLGGPVGAAAGGIVGGGMFSSPRLNLGRGQVGMDRYSL